MSSINDVVRILQQQGYSAQVGNAEGKDFPIINIGAWKIAARFNPNSLFWGGDYSRLVLPDYRPGFWNWVVSPRLDLWGCQYATGTLRGFDSYEVDAREFASILELIAKDPCGFPRSQGTFKFACPSCFDCWDESDAYTEDYSTPENCDWLIVTPHGNFQYLNTSLSIAGEVPSESQLRYVFGADYVLQILKDSKNISWQSFYGEYEFLKGFKEATYNLFAQAKLMQLEEKITYLEKELNKSSDLRKVQIHRALGNLVQSSSIAYAGYGRRNPDLAFEFWILNRRFYDKDPTIDLDEILDCAIEFGSLEAEMLRLEFNINNREATEREIDHVAKLALQGSAIATKFLFTKHRSNFSTDEFLRIMNLCLKRNDYSLVVMQAQLISDKFGREKVVSWVDDILDTKWYELSDSQHSSLSAGSASALKGIGLDESSPQVLNHIKSAALHGHSDSAMYMFRESFDNAKLDQSEENMKAVKYWDDISLATFHIGLIGAKAKGAIKNGDFSAAFAFYNFLVTNNLYQYGNLNFGLVFAELLDEYGFENEASIVRKVCAN